MLIDNPPRYRRHRKAVVWALLMLFAIEVEAIGLSRNPLFGAMQNYRRHIFSSSSPVNHIQRQQHFHQQQHQQHQIEPVASPSSNIQSAIPLSATYNSEAAGVDPYVNNAAESKVVTDGSAIADSSAAASATSALLASAAAQSAASNLVGASSYTSNSYASTGAAAYGAGGTGAGSYGSGAGSYGGAGAGGSYGAAGSTGVAGGYGGASAGVYGGGGSSVGSYGGGASSIGSYGGGGSSIGSFGGGLGGHTPGYGAGLGDSSYSISYPAMMNTGASKEDTLHLLSSLAPSLLLSSLLLPLALALLSNATGLLSGRKKRDTYSLDDDYDEDIQLATLKFDELDADIMANDSHFFKTADALIDSSKPVDFVEQQGLSDLANTCLEKMACLSAGVSKFKRSDKLKKTIKLLHRSGDNKIQQRIKEGKAVGSFNERDCLTKFVCQSMKMSKS